MELQAPSAIRGSSGLFPLRFRVLWPLVQPAAAHYVPRRSQSLSRPRTVFVPSARSLCPERSHPFRALAVWPLASRDGRASLCCAAFNRRSSVSPPPPFRYPAPSAVWQIQLSSVGYWPSPVAGSTVISLLTAIFLLVSPVIARVWALRCGPFLALLPRSSPHSPRSLFSSLPFWPSAFLWSSFGSARPSVSAPPLPDRLSLLPVPPACPSCSCPAPALLPPCRCLCPSLPVPVPVPGSTAARAVFVCLSTPLLCRSCDLSMICPRRSPVRVVVRGRVRSRFRSAQLLFVTPVRPAHGGFRCASGHRTPAPGRAQEAGSRFAEGAGASGGRAGTEETLGDRH